MRPQTMEAPVYVLTMTEAQFQNLVVDTAKTFGWHVTHIPRMQGNPSGFPDLLCLRDDTYLLVELKTERGKVRSTQERWTADAEHYGVRVHLWRPSDWDALVPILRDGPGLLPHEMA